MAEIKQGKNQILLWRLLADAKTKKGTMLMFQTEHSTEKSRDADTLTTKSGTIRKQGALEEEVPFKSLVGVDDPVIEMLHTAIDEEDQLVELWDVDFTKESTTGKYNAVYRQGYITELSTTANAEDEMEIEGTFVTNLRAQKGEVTLTKEQIEAIQYQFRDVTEQTD